MIPGIHYNPLHTYTHMAERTTIRLLFDLTAAYNLHIEAFDIKSAYIHELYDPSHTVYVKQPPRFNGELKHKDKTGILIRNLYGTPPAAHIYSTALFRFLKSCGYIPSHTDPTLFSHIHSPTKYIHFAISMDDFLIISTHQQLIVKLHSELRRKYDIKRIGKPTQHLGWHISYRQQDSAIHIGQPQLTKHALERAGMHESNPTQTPYPEPLDDSHIPQPLTSTESTKFRSILGELRYIADSTRPDIHLSVNRLAANMAAPSSTDQSHLKRVLRYLRETPTHGLTFLPVSDPSKHHLHSFVDADHANGSDRKSTTGTVHTFNNTPIFWSSKKQSTVALSTCAAEYIAASHASEQTMWLR